MSHERERRPGDHDAGADRVSGHKTTPVARRPPMGDREAASVVTAAADVLADSPCDELPYLTPRDRTAIWNLGVASTGHDGSQPVDGARRLAAFTSAMEVLGPAIAAIGRDDGSREWLDDYINGPLQTVRDDVEYVAASDRVQRSVLIDGDRVIDPETATSPREQAALLHGSMPKLIATVRQVNELVAKLPEEQVKEHVQHVIEAHSQGRARFQSLLELGNALTLLDGLLVLTDDELRQHYNEATGILGKITTFAELVKGVVEFTGGCIGIVGSVTAILAKAAGMPDVASLAAAFASKVASTVGLVLTGIEVMHGLLVLADPHASQQEKVDASVDVASGALWLGKDLIEGGWAGPASIAVEVGYAVYKASLQYAAEAALGLEVGIMRPAFETLLRDGNHIARLCPDVAKARILVDSETDGQRKAALQRVLEIRTSMLRQSLDTLICDLQPPDLEAGMARVPGRYQILRDAMAPVLQHRLGNDPHEVLRTAKTALDRITWVLQREDQIEIAAAKSQGIESVTDGQEHGDDR